MLNQRFAIKDWPSTITPIINILITMMGNYWWPTIMKQGKLNYSMIMKHCQQLSLATISCLKRFFGVTILTHTNHTNCAEVKFQETFARPRCPIAAKHACSYSPGTKPAAGSSAIVESGSVSWQDGWANINWHDKSFSWNKVASWLLSSIIDHSNQYWPLLVCTAGC